MIGIIVQAKIGRIDNIAPNFLLNAKVKSNKKLNIHVLSDYKGQKSLDVESKLNEFKGLMFSKGIDVNINYENNSQQTIEYAKSLDDYIFDNGYACIIKNSDVYVKMDTEYARYFNHYLYGEDGDYTKYPINKFIKIERLPKTKKIGITYDRSAIKGLATGFDNNIYSWGGRWPQLRNIEGSDDESKSLGNMKLTKDKILYKDNIKVDDNVLYLDSYYYIKKATEDSMKLIPISDIYGFNHAYDCDYYTINVPYFINLPNIKDTNGNYFITNDNKLFYLTTQVKTSTNLIPNITYLEDDAKKIISASTDYYHSNYENGGQTYYSERIDFESTLIYINTKDELVIDVIKTNPLTKQINREVGYPKILSSGCLDARRIIYNRILVLTKDKKLKMLEEVEGNNKAYNTLNYDFSDMLNKMSIFNLNSINLNSEPTLNNKDITILMSDGVGDDYSKSFGEYYSFSSLNQDFSTKLQVNNSEVYTITPEQNLKYKNENSIIQNITLENLLSNTNGKNYDSTLTGGLSQLELLLKDLNESNNISIEKLNNEQADLNTDVTKEVLVDRRKPGYVAKEDTIIFEKSYEDYEEDPQHLGESPQYNYRWKYKHYNTNFLETNNTIECKNENNNFNLKIREDEWTKEISNFDFAGNYFATYQAQDDSAINENAFDEYKRWSNENTIQINVNRRPTAKFKYTVATIHGTNTMSFDVNNISYDIDHTDSSKFDKIIGKEINLKDKGLEIVQYRWKAQDELHWHMGSEPLKVLNKGKIYSIVLVVRDIEGFISFPYIEIIDTMHPKPIADFNVSDVSYINDANIVVDKSIHSDNSVKIASWKWELINTDNNVAINTFIQNVAQNSAERQWDINNKISTLPIGNYKLNQTVIDENGMEDYITKNFIIVEPIKLQIDPVNLNWKNYSIAIDVTITGGYGFKESTYTLQKKGDVSLVSPIAANVIELDNPKRKNFKVNIDKLNEGEWILIVEARDFHGKDKGYDKKIGDYKIDITAPTIDFKFNDNLRDGNIHVEDNLSGIKSIWYKWSDGDIIINEADLKSETTKGFINSYNGISQTKDITITKPKGNHKYLHVIALDNTDTGNYSYNKFGEYNEALKLVDFRIKSMVNPPQKYTFPISLSNLPATVKAGYNNSFEINCEGVADIVSVIVKDKDSNYITNLNMIKKYDIDSLHSVWGFDYATNLEMPVEQIIKFEIEARNENSICNYNQIENWNGDTLKIVGNALEDVRIYRKH